MTKSINYKSHRYHGGYVPKKQPYTTCTENVFIKGATKIPCPNEGMPNREGMRDACYKWNLKRHGIYPHKNNDNRCVESYLIM
jgi:hypothetical protein